MSKKNILSDFTLSNDLVELGLSKENARASINYFRGYVDGTYVSEVCQVCHKTHAYYEHKANKRLIRNLDTLMEHGGSMPTRGQRVKNNLEHHDVNKKSLLVHFGLAYVEEMYNENGDYVGTYYTVTDLGKKVYEGTGKIPLIITIRDGEVVDKLTKCPVTRYQVEEEYFVGAKFKKTASKDNVKYRYLNLREFTEEKYNKHFINIETN